MLSVCFPCCCPFHAHPNPFNIASTSHAFSWIVKLPGCMVSCCLPTLAVTLISKLGGLCHRLISPLKYNQCCNAAILTFHARNKERAIVSCWVSRSWSDSLTRHKVAPFSPQNVCVHRPYSMHWHLRRTSFVALLTAGIV